MNSDEATIGGELSIILICFMFCFQFERYNLSLESPTSYRRTERAVTDRAEAIVFLSYSLFLLFVFNIHSFYVTY